jgi:hypothetical protein
MTMIGFDGIVEVNAGGGDRRLVIDTGDGQCAVNVARVDLGSDQPPPLNCEPQAAAPVGEAASRQIIANSAPGRTTKRKRLATRQ